MLGSMASEQCILKHSKWAAKFYMNMYLDNCMHMHIISFIIKCYLKKTHGKQPLL
jgi:hypothetical protein